MQNKSSSQLYFLLAIVSMLTFSAYSESEAKKQKTEPGAVRLATLKSSGSVSGKFSPADYSKAKIIGRCDPNMFANFGVHFGPSDGWRKVGITIMSKDEIKANQKGSIELDWVQVSFTDNEYNATEFRGPAEFVIESHDINGPRMSGTVKGRLPGYGGLLAKTKVDPNRSIKIEFTFDINAACGVTK